MKIIEVFELPDGHPEVTQWAAEISTRLPDTYGHILQTLARFADENGHVRGLSQYEIARYARVTPGKVSEALRTIAFLGPIKSSSRKGLKQHSSNEYQLMGEYHDWAIRLSKAEIEKPFNTLVWNILEVRRQEYEAKKREIEVLQETQRQKLEVLVRKAEDRMVRLEAEGRIEELTALKEKVEAMKSLHG